MPLRDDDFDPGFACQRLCSSPCARRGFNSLGVLLGTEVVHGPTSTSVYRGAAVTYVVCRDALYVPAVYSGSGEGVALG